MLSGKELAKRTGVTRSDLQNYRLKGLITPIQQADNKYWLYSDMTELKVQIIKLYHKELDIPLCDIKRMDEESDSEFVKSMSDVRDRLIEKRDRYNLLIDRVSDFLNLFQTSMQENGEFSDVLSGMDLQTVRAFFTIGLSGLQSGEISAISDHPEDIEDSRMILRIISKCKKIVKAGSCTREESDDLLSDCLYLLSLHYEDVTKEALLTLLFKLSREDIHDMFEAEDEDDAEFFSMFKSVINEDEIMQILKLLKSQFGKDELK